MPAQSGLRNNSRIRLFLSLAAGCWLLAAGLSGCAPTYPKEKFADSIVNICKKEYNLDVKVQVAGRTVAIYAPLKELWDQTFGLSKQAGEEINNVILSVSRVALSTDADCDFYVVIAHDIRIPEIQVIIIKYVEDVKRFMLNDISRGEFAKRMLVDKRINPQAKKEQAIKEVFERMGLDRKWQDSVMNDFFRAQPAAVGDIGYWNNRFYIKDISLPEYLAEQIASRVRIEFFENKDLEEAAMIRAARGSYSTKNGRRVFEIDIMPEVRTFAEGADYKKTTETVFAAGIKVAAEVLHGYGFDKYDYIEIVDETAGKSIKAAKDTAEEFRKKKIDFEDILDRA